MISLWCPAQQVAQAIHRFPPNNRPFPVWIGIEWIKGEMDVVTWNVILVSLCLCLTSVKVVPETAAHDKESRVSIPVSEEEERVPAHAGGPPEGGAVRERGAQVWEWQPEETAGRHAVWGKSHEFAETSTQMRTPVQMLQDWKVTQQISWGV